MQYDSYVLRTSGRRQTFAIYDNLANQPLCKRDQSPYTTTNKSKADKLAAKLNSARDAASVAGALVDFGAPQSEAWRYAQSVYDLDGIAAMREP